MSSPSASSAAGARTELGDWSRCARTTRSGSSRGKGPPTQPAAAPHLPSSRDTSPAGLTARHAGRDRKRGRPRERGRSRVRRPPAVHAGRPGALGQLARERAARRPRRQRAPSRAERRRRRLSRHLRRCPARDASSLDRAVRAASTLGEHYLERRDRVGLVALGGTLRWLAARGRARPELPADRCPARDGGRVHVRLEGREHHPGPDAAAPRSDRRRHPAPRPARDRGAARPAGARP